VGNPLIACNSICRMTGTLRNDSPKSTSTGAMYALGRWIIAVISISLKGIKIDKRKTNEKKIYIVLPSSVITSKWFNNAPSSVADKRTGMS
jgi:hypothetical protein